ncbi:hypothetical protein [Novosphingobium sp. AAP93]|uniref:hypothetical protein n=1 Tax=Novosphingobium sp. AAP93 TaxID=1523427 RepID=UPI0012E13A2B|nr:hypothetical protein [Novosphingobium sp. AAP93]
MLDANTNRVSLINIHDELSSPQFPFLIPLFSVLAITKKEDGEDDEGSCAIRVSLGDQTVLDAPILVNYQGADIHRSMLGLHGLVITGPGTLKVQLLHNEAEIGEWQISVKQLAPAIIVNGQEA